MNKNQHVVPCGIKWAVRGEGNSKVTEIFNIKSRALNLARQIAINQQSEVVIHNSHGIITDKDSYGRDPYPPRDKKH